MTELRCVYDVAMDMPTELDSLLNQCRALHFSVRMVAGLLLVKPVTHSSNDKVSLKGFRLQALDSEELPALVEELVSSLNLLTSKIKALVPKELKRSWTEVPVCIGDDASPFFGLCCALHENISAMDDLCECRRSRFRYSY